PKPFLQMNNSTPVEGMPVVMICTVKEGTPPIVYSWQHDTNRDGMVVLAEAVTPLLNLTSANRTYMGWYTCTAHNEVNSQTSNGMYLDVIYGPDEPVISIEPFAINQHGFSANEQEEVIMTCLAPSNPPSHYIWFYNSSQVYSGQKYVIARISRTQTGIYTCLAQNMHLNTRTQATIILTVYWTLACSVIATKLNEFLMLTCDWPGGNPQVMLWWRDWRHHVLGGTKPSHNVFIMKPNTTLGGKAFTCMAAHPLWARTAECHVRLEPPKLMVERSKVSLFEGSEVQLACFLQGAYLGSEVLWYNNKNQPITANTRKYHLQQKNTWFNLTLQDIEWIRDSGIYRCAAINAVGNDSATISLQVKKYPNPPNVTISRLMYTRPRTEVELEWETRGSGNLTGFVVQRREAKKTGPKQMTSSWETVANNIDPDVRGRKLGGLDPAVVYAFRILAVNHRTTGYPSEMKTPGAFE
ncbi:V-set and immunoglobulin domain-containing protein 10-like 2, partial [Protobothrops mucrosquamatus]|uniref:V-set and immunoglobulin domain-containing protein 10-like 2 n=1 Tax=Protobothrops mucrosquamatus TaxID=103944 RepID=UPI0010FAD8F0